jgi:hypothetical protein
VAKSNTSPQANPHNKQRARSLRWTRDCIKTADLQHVLARLS